MELPAQSAAGGAACKKASQQKASGGLHRRSGRLVPRPPPLSPRCAPPPPCAYFSADVDEQSKNEIKDILLTYDRTLLVADPRRCEPKKFGGASAC